MQFEPFPKIGRALRNMVITEKIDGTNGQIMIAHRDTVNPDVIDRAEIPFMCVGENLIVAGSRNRFVSQANDNQGFGRWVSENREELVEGLGEGTHFGEWWGQGIQRKYGLTEKRFSLFNTFRWTKERPSCCGVVPILYEGLFDTNIIHYVIQDLEAFGSKAVPGFMNPEGIMIYHTACKTYMKVTVNNDGLPKSLVKEEK